jgi:predicted RNA binding protein YcfA (HicA-like mRNA interferase family)
MAAQLRPMKGREVLRKLRKAGFEIVRIIRKRSLLEQSPNR